ncbi:MAG: hypothetical protein HQ461_10830, partial [Deltaproteobacteria bacterium]|nr:hypothetical protein [Deltaproteobacteria bacterium]
EEGLAVSGTSLAQLQSVAAALTASAPEELLGFEIRTATLDDLLDELRP